MKNTKHKMKKLIKNILLINLFGNFNAYVMTSSSQIINPEDYKLRKDLNNDKIYFGEEKIKFRTIKRIIKKDACNYFLFEAIFSNFKLEELIKFSKNNKLCDNLILMNIQDIHLKEEQIKIIIKYLKYIKNNDFNINNNFDINIILNLSNTKKVDIAIKNFYLEMLKSHLNKETKNIFEKMISMIKNSSQEEKFNSIECSQLIMNIFIKNIFKEIFSLIDDYKYQEHSLHYKVPGVSFEALLEKNPMLKYDLFDILTEILPEEFLLEIISCCNNFINSNKEMINNLTEQQIALYELQNHLYNEKIKLYKENIKQIVKKYFLKEKEKQITEKQED
jgi:hypothetical protein